MTIANFERALVGWHSSRMLTEWVIFVNVILATALILILPSENVSPLPVVEKDYKILLRKHLGVMAASMLIAGTLFTFTNRWIYHYPKYEQLDLKRKNIHTRFGPEADWRAKPNLKNAEHK